MAEKQIGDNYCGIMLPDEIMMSDDIPALMQLMHIAQERNCSVIAAQEVPASSVSSYGIIATQKEVAPNLFVIDHLVEKPKAGNAPSNLAIIGRYVLSPRIFDSLKNITPGAGGEIQLTDGITDMMSKGEQVLAYVVKAERHDIGNPVGWLKANIASSLKNEKYAVQIKEYLTRLIK
jgi:UTP--glucose-1-phosphate uridylyltransferase